MVVLNVSPDELRSCQDALLKEGKAPLYDGSWGAMMRPGLPGSSVLSRRASRQWAKALKAARSLWRREIHTGRGYQVGTSYKSALVAHAWL